MFPNIHVSTGRGCEIDKKTGSLVDHCNPRMYLPVIQKPVHECAFWWHHIRILATLLRSFLLLGEFWTVMTRCMFLDTSAMRRWIEPGGLLEDSGFGSASRGEAAGCWGTTKCDPQ